MADQYFQLPDGRVVRALPQGGYQVVSGGQNPLADPRLGYQTQTAAGQAAAAPYEAPKAAADLARTRVETNVAQVTAPSEIAQKQANARQTAAQAASAEANLETTGGANEGQAKSASFYTRASKANQLYEGTGVRDNPAGRNIAKALLPDALVNEFTSPARQQAEAAQRDFIASTLRYESGANIPQNEFELQKSIYFPAPGDDPQTIALKAKLRQNAIEGLKVASGPAARMLDQAPAATTMGQAVRSVLPEAVGGRSTYTNEEDPQAAAAVDRLIRMGRPVDEIAAFAKSRGFTQFDANAARQAELYAKEHPEYKGGFTQATRARPMSAKETVFGSPLGAFGSGAASAATLGLNDEMAGAINAMQGGGYAQGRDAFNASKQLLGAEHPYATMAGTALGSIAPFGIAGGLAGSARANLAADTALGATYGAGESNEDRTGGAILGGLAGGVGNLLGRGVAHGVASAISPTGGKLAPLYEMGVRPSIGQRFGGVVGNLEEKMQSLPFVGDAIHGTRQQARDQFQVGLFNDALGDIGLQLPKGMKPGHEPHAFAQDAFNRAYDAAKSNMTAVADGPLSQDIGALQQSVGNLRPESQQQFAKLWSGSVARRFQDGVLSGQAFKDATSELEKKIAAIRSSKTGDGELADALQQAVDSIRGSAMRNSHPEAVSAMDAVDRGYAKLVRIEDASKRAGGDAATFSPAQYNAAVRDTSGGVRKRSYLAGNALNTDIAAAGLNLADKVSNSGTVDRYAPLALATGLGWAEPKSLLAIGGYGALNAPGVRNYTMGMFAPRGQKARTVADIIRKQLAGPAGAAGAAGGLGLLGLLAPQ